MEAYGKTDVGKSRSVNQDTIYYTAAPIGCLENLFIVADGMGGHAAGDFASRFTVDNLVKLIGGSGTSTHHMKMIDENIKLVNKMLSRCADENLEMYGMGTTLVLATIENNMLYVANVGDSRLYVIKDEIRQITRDHSYVEAMVRAGEIKRDSDEYYEKKNYITRAIGCPTDVVADYFEIEVEKDSQILLCSDGLTNMMSDQEILTVMKHDWDIKKKVDSLIDMANKNGGADNISVLVVKP